MRWLLIIMLTWVTVALTTLTATVAGAEDKDDRGFIQGMLEDALSAEGRTVSIEGFAGALSSEATIDKITIADADGIWLTLDKVVMSWRRTALLKGRIDIEELSAARIAMPRLPIPPEDAMLDSTEVKPFELPELPVSVKIAKIDAQKVEIGKAVAGSDAVFAVTGALKLDDGEGNADLKVERTDKPALLTAKVGFSNDSRELLADIDLHEEKDGFLSNALDLPGKPSIDLTFKGDAPISDFTGDLLLSTDGEERVSGTLKIASVEAKSAESGSEPATETRVGVDLSGDVTPLIPKQYRSFFGTESHVKAEVTRHPDGGMDLHELSVDAEEITLNGTASIRADGMPVKFDLSGQLGDGNPVQLPVSGTPIFVNEATIKARYDEAEGDAWTMLFVARNFAREDISIESLRLDGGGTIQAKKPRSFGADFDFAATGFGHKDPAVQQAAGSDITGHAALSWHDGKPLEISTLTLNGAGLSSELRGTFGSIADGLPFKGNFSLKADDISRFSALSGQDIAGKVAFNASGSSEILTGAFDVEARAETQALAIGQPYADRLLRGDATVMLNMQRDESGIWVAPLSIRTPDATAELRGGLNTKQGQFVLNADLDDLGVVEPRLSGAGQVRLRADWNKGADIRFHDFKIVLGETTLEGQGQIWPERAGKPLQGNLHLVSPDLSRLSKLAGRPLQGRVDLAMNGSGEIETGKFDAAGSLTGDNLSAGIPDVDKLLRGSIWMRTKVSGSPDSVKVDYFELDTPELDVSASGAIGGPTPLTLSARLNDLGLYAPEFRGPLTAEGTIRAAALNAQRLDLDLRMTGPGGVTADVNGQVLDGGQRLGLRMQGRAPLGLANSYITPRSLSGTAAFDLTLNGPPALDSVTGSVTTNDARLAMPNLNVALEKIRGKIGLAASRANIDLKGDMTSGGSIEINGPVGLTPPNEADLKIKLNKIRLKDPQLYETKVKGDIRISGPLATGGLISGKLKLPITEIRVPSSGITSLGAIPDINHIREPSAVHASRERSGLVINPSEKREQSGPVFKLDLTIEASNEIFVRGRGLDAELGGKLTLRGTTRDVIPSGQFNLIRGRLDILSKRLELTEGNITLQGDFNAYLRLVAERQVESTLIQIIIDGLVSDPKVSFESQPSLPQEEVVSMLIFGRGLDQISAFQAVRLAAAVAELAGKRSGGLMSGLRSATGLSDFDVNTDDEGRAQVSAGFYISDQVYSQVAVDDHGEAEVNVNMDITKSLSVKGTVQSQGNTGIGIFFEKDY